ncbi:MAG: hypothetical protein ABJC13_01075 [Acidobacteriota bacterium]
MTFLPIVLPMGDTPTRNSSRSRPTHPRGARTVRIYARPAFSPANSPEPRAEADLASLRRFGRLLMHRGEQATRDGDHLNAAAHFERAAWAYEVAGEPLAAAEATLEVGRCLLYLNLPERLPALAGRIENLAREEAKNLPEGGLITLRVWAAILRKGAADPSPFLQLIRTRRRARRQGAPRPAHPTSGGLPVIDGMPPLFLIPPLGFSAPRAAMDDWALSPDGNWFVLIFEEPSAATRIESGRRVIDLGRLLNCPARWEIERKRVIVKVAADHRGYALITALRDQERRAEETVS